MAQAITFLAHRSERGASLAWLHPDDFVSVHQTNPQEQARPVSEASLVGRIDDDGNYIPPGKDATTGAWRPQTAICRHSSSQGPLTRRHP